MDHERQAEIDRTVLDALNVAYVAATRAVDRLDIGLEFDKPPSADMAIQTLPQLLWKGWQEAFPERVNGATVLDNFGANDRKARSADDQAVEWTTCSGSRWDSRTASALPVPSCIGQPCFRRQMDAHRARECGSWFVG